MPYNGSGVFTRVYNWVSDAAAAIPITASRVDTEDDGIATGLSNCICRDGQSTITANLPMSGFAHTGVGNATAANQYAVVSQIQNSSYTWVAAGGTADAITATYSPAVTTLADGMELKFRATAANTSTTPTFSPNGLTARTIVQKGGSALAAGTIPAANYEGTLRYNLANTRWELLNPIPASASANPFSDAAALVKNSSDATKLIILSAASITTATTRTLTAQDKNYTIADNADLAAKAPLASPTFTGTPAAPTASNGTNTTQLATTAFAYGSLTAADPGSVTFPNGLIVKWGTGPTLANNVHGTVSFSSAFPNNCWVVTNCAYTAGADSSDMLFGIDSITTSGFGVTGNTSGTSPTLKWIAIGN